MGTLFPPNSPVRAVYWYLLMSVNQGWNLVSKTITDLIKPNECASHPLSAQKKEQSGLFLYWRQLQAMEPMPNEWAAVQVRAKLCRLNGFPGYKHKSQEIWLQPGWTEKRGALRNGECERQLIALPSFGDFWARKCFLFVFSSCSEKQNIMWKYL